MTHRLVMTLLLGVLVGTVRAEVAATLVAAMGTVEIERPPAAGWTALRAGASLRGGERLRTGLQSNAKVLLGARAVVTMGERSSVTLGCPPASDVPALCHLAGRVRVVSVDAPGRGPRVAAGPVVIDIAGTIVVAVEPTRTLIGVVGGVGSVRTSARADGTRVAAGHALEVGTDGAMRALAFEAEPLAAAIDETEWLDGGHDPEAAIDASFAEHPLRPASPEQTLADEVRAPLIDGGTNLSERQPVGQSEFPCVDDPRPPECEHPRGRHHRPIRRRDRR
jgi:hypothetical protein